jgi:hypothetical protein
LCLNISNTFKFHHLILFCKKSESLAYFKQIIFFYETLGLWFWCLTPLSTIFISWRPFFCVEKTTGLPQVYNTWIVYYFLCSVYVKPLLSCLNSYLFNLYFHLFAQWKYCFHCISSETTYTMDSSRHNWLRGPDAVSDHVDITLHLFTS